MKTYQKVKFVCVKNVSILIISLAFAIASVAIVIGAEEIEESSGDGDGEFADLQTDNLKVQISNGKMNLKIMSKHQIEMLENRNQKSKSKSKMGKEEESSGFREVDEENVNNVNANVPDDDDEDNERENPPFPPRNDAFWKEEQKPRGLKPNDNARGEPISKNSKKEAKANDPRPNIILILTDDQDIELGSMEYMPETLRIFREGGAEFRHAYVTTPMCCPSRSSMLTGLYVHNHQVYTNNDNCSSVLWRERFEKKTFASYLWTEGYYTSYIGKYLNKYDGSHIPHGWDEWNALLMNSRFYNYTLNRNGKKIRYGNKYEHDYYPDSIANDTINFLNRMSISSSEDQESESESKGSPPTDAPLPNPIPPLKKLPSHPFLLVVSFPSPHGPEDSAPQYSQMFFNDTPHHTPSYNYAPNLDKQWILRTTSRMNPVLKDYTNLLMTKRLQTLQSVDLAVKNIFAILKSKQLIDNTYVFYTSDHGYHVGQFGLIKGKSMPYEFDIRVPFFITTPKNVVTEKTLIMEPVLNIDLAPTFLDLAGVNVPADMDGRSIVPLIQKYSQSSGLKIKVDAEGETPEFKWTEMFVIESSGRRDIGPDGGSLPNSQGQSHSKKSSVLTLSTKISRNNATARSKNKSLDISEVDGLIIDNETIEMTNLCLAHPHPCQPGQKKYCRREATRIRFRKCRTALDFVSLDDELADGTAYTNSSSTCRCRLRSKRDADEDPLEFDWESERQKIDAEIEALKLRIESLRDRRRDMRRRWTSKIYAAKLEKSRAAAGSATAFGDSKKKNQIEVTIIHTPNTKVEEMVPTITVPKRPVGSNGDLEIQIKSELQTSFHPTTADVEPTVETLTIGSRKRITIENLPENTEGKQNNEKRARQPRPRPHPRPKANENPNSDEDHDLKIEENLNEEIIGHEKPRSNSNSGLLVEENKTVKPSHNENDDQSQEGMIDGEGGAGSLRGQRKSGKGRKGKNRGQFDKINKHQGKFDVKERGDDENGENGTCDCSTNPNPKWTTQNEKEERKRKKLMSKLRKKQRFLNRIDDPRERHEAETCGTEDRMNCFWHDKDHWRTAPLWTSESFCFCMNSNNNSYSCLRAINSTHNYIYCQFITGFKMYFDLRQDPYELRNLIGHLSINEESWIISELIRLKSCQGREDCGSQKSPLVVRNESLPPSIWEKIFGRWRRKKKNRNGMNRNTDITSSAV